MNWRKSILVRVAVLFVLLGSVTAVSMGIIAYSFAKHAIAKICTTHIRTLFGNSAKVLILKCRRIWLSLLLCTNDENLKKIFMENNASEYEMIQMEARAVDIVRQTKNTQPLNNCNIIFI